MNPVLRGQIALVTGGSRGIGRAICLELAKAGAFVVVNYRSNRKAANETLELIRGNGGGGETICFDVADPKVTAEEVDLLLVRHNSIDILINNAGDAFKRRELSVDGVELTFATNVLGAFVLTNALIPLLQSSAPARIINVSSGGMYLAKLDLNDLQFERRKYDQLGAYAQSKRALMMLTELWAEQWKPSGVTANCMHPGWVDTPLLQTGLPAFRQSLRSILRTPDEGADTIVWLAAARQVESVTGRFWFDRRERPMHKLFLTKSSPADYQRLWKECGRLAQISKG